MSMMVIYDCRLGGIDVYICYGGPIYSDISRGIIATRWEIISGTGMVIKVERTGVNACSIRAKCIDKIQRQNSFATMVQDGANT